MDSIQRKDNRTRAYVTPTRVLWQSGEQVQCANVLLKESNGQPSLEPGETCLLREGGALLLDFGTELQGGVQIVTYKCGKNRSARLRIRFGESASEAMSELGEKNSGNDHAVRDMEITVPFMSGTEAGSTGFRFVRIDLLGEGAEVTLKSVRAVALYRDIPCRGSFSCSDDLLNQVWKTGANTVHLNMQEYLWDGIKRDRLVWVGDMHPETATVQAVFGWNECVEKSLDLSREEYPPTGWMNGIPSYSMWWIIIHYDWYLHNGNMAYLNSQRVYLLELLKHLFRMIRPDGTNQIENPFIDWPTKESLLAQEAGLHAILVRSLYCAKALCGYLEEIEMAQRCDQMLAVLKRHLPAHGGNKSAAALLAWSGLLDSKTANHEVLSKDPAHGLSTFLGYYVLNARAQAGDIEGCIALIKTYWGGMLRLGATTFWEDFDIDWAEGASRIDELPKPGQKDVHGDNGRYCYKGFRHSLCHGWASGPTPWMTKYLLGFQPLEPGCSKVMIDSRLGGLQWAEGTIPTPKGTVAIRSERTSEGKTMVYVEAPDSIEVVRKGE